MNTASDMNDWHQRVQGADCSLDAPRPDRNDFWVKVRRLSASTLYLHRNQTYRGYCVLVFAPRHVTRLEALSDDEDLAFLRDLRRAARAVVTVCDPDHVNYACLGNVLPHLHWHLIPRYRDDPRWRKPIWTTHEEELIVTHLSEKEQQRLADEIGQALDEQL